MNNPIAIFDIDGTLVKGQSQRRLISYLYAHRYISIRYFATIYLWFILYKLSLVKNPKRVMEYAISFLRNRSVAEVDEILETFVRTELSKHFYPNAVRRLERERQRGTTILLASNAIEPLTKAIATFLQVPYHVGTQLTVDQKHYTGSISGDLMYGQHKAVYARSFIAKHSSGGNTEIHAYSDHHSDIPLLQYATIPHAANPTAQLHSFATLHNWDIVDFR